MGFAGIRAHMRQSQDWPPIPVKPITEGFSEHDNLVQFSFPLIPSRYTAGVMGKKRRVFQKNKQVLHFVKRPPNNRGEIHW
jgi:hypothetical protein